MDSVFFTSQNVVLRYGNLSTLELIAILSSKKDCHGKEEKTKLHKYVEHSRTFFKTLQILNLAILNFILKCQKI